MNSLPRISIGLIAAMVAAVAQEVVWVDFRNYIPGALDAPVFDVGGVTPLSGEGFDAQVYFSTVENGGEASFIPTGIICPFQIGTNAGYWEPRQAPLPGVSLGQTVFVKAVAFEHVTVPPFGERGIRGESKTLSLHVTNSLTPLLGLKSFSLQPESLRARREGSRIVIQWTNLGATRYELQATADLKPSVFWDVVPIPSTPPVYFGEDFSVTNSIDGPYRCYRLQRWR
jgi:hypothetical protein